MCLITYRVIEQSKPDGKKTVILVVGNQQDVEYIIERLVEAGVDQKKIANDNLSKNVTQCFDHVVDLIKTKTNPP